MRVRRFRFRPGMEILSSRIAPSGDLVGAALAADAESETISDSGGASGDVAPGFSEWTSSDALDGLPGDDPSGPDVDPMGDDVPGESEFTVAVAILPFQA